MDIRHIAIDGHPHRGMGPIETLVEIGKTSHLDTHADKQGVGFRRVFIDIQNNLQQPRHLTSIHIVCYNELIVVVIEQAEF